MTKDGGRPRPVPHCLLVRGFSFGFRVSGFGFLSGFLVSGSDFSPGFGFRIFQRYGTGCPSSAARAFAFSAVGVPGYFLTTSWQNLATSPFCWAVALVRAPFTFAKALRAASSDLTALSSPSALTPAAAAGPGSSVLKAAAALAYRS